MKKFEVKSLIVMLLALAMVLALAACGKPAETTAPSDVTDPVVTDPTETDPPETDPTEIDPVVTDPAQTDPVETNPPETDPKYDPIVTDPVVTDPPATEPVETTKPEETTKAPETTKKPEETLSPSAGGEHECLYTKQIVSNPGCVSDGESAMVCSYCGDAKDYEVIPALGHAYVEQEMLIVSPTHHEAKVAYCDRCKSVHGIIEYTNAHEFHSATVVADYVTDAGYIVFGGEELECECGYALYIASNATDGHCYEAEEGSGKMVCRCGKAAPADVVYNNNPNAGPQIFAAN